MDPEQRFEVERWRLLRPIHQSTDTRDARSGVLAQRDDLGRRTAGRDHVLNDEDALPGLDVLASAERHDTVDSLGEKEPASDGVRHGVADEDPAERRRYHDVDAARVALRDRFAE